MEDYRGDNNFGSLKKKHINTEVRRAFHEKNNLLSFTISLQKLIAGYLIQSFEITEKFASCHIPRLFLASYI